MRNHFIFLFLSMAMFVGCKSVHTAGSQGQNRLPVAVWSSLIGTDLKTGQPVHPKADDIIVKVLRERGLHPTLDDEGVSVPDSESRQATEVLLTDKRLVNSDVVVLLAVPAGTGRKTAGGFEVPAVAPH